jgi:tetratricopeptide (TPR) repeat protein
MDKVGVAKVYNPFGLYCKTRNMYRFSAGSVVRLALVSTSSLGANIALVQSISAAKSTTQVAEIASAITVEIKTANSSKVGSGILFQRQGDIYTVLTAAHVVKEGESFTIKTADGKVYQSIANSIRQAANNIDLAVVKFQSSNNYTLTKIGAGNNIKIGSATYVAGFPEPTYAIAAGIFNFTKGEVIGNATKGNDKGYSLIYSNITFRGMSGGPVLNAEGELIAIHGQGDRTGQRGEGEKTGRNLGITIERFGTVATTMGVTIQQPVASLPANQGLNATDYFLAGNEKNERGDVQGAIDDYNKAISISPTLAEAFNNRGLLKANSGDIAGALADYNQSLSIKPQQPEPYNNRGMIKEKLNDLTGAMNDYNRAIAINPQYAIAYDNRAALKQDLNDLTGAMNDYQQAIALDPSTNAYNNRGHLKAHRLNDPSGALADFNQAIANNPKYAGAFNNRGWLKANKLQDISGALADFNQAIALNPKFSNAYNHRGWLKANSLNDPSGALTDLNQAITINPKYAQVYYRRGWLKANKLNDKAGAIADLRQAQALYGKQSPNPELQETIQQLRRLGAS